MLDSAMRIAWPSLVIAAMPLLTAGMMAGDRPSNGSSSNRSSGSRASARAIERKMLSIALAPGPVRALQLRSDRRTEVAGPLRAVAGGPPAGARAARELVRVAVARAR